MTLSNSHGFSHQFIIGLVHCREAAESTSRNHAISEIEAAYRLLTCIKSDKSNRHREWEGGMLTFLITSQRDNWRIRR